MRDGFTLLEVLAATVVLGILAVAVVPLTRHLVDDQGRLRACREARDLVTGIDPAAFPRAGVATPLEAHAGWWLRSEALTCQTPPPIPGQMSVRPAYAWARLVIAAGPSASDGVLAERLVLIPGGP